MPYYLYTAKGMIEAETIDDAVDILYITLEDITSSCELRVSDKEKEVIQKWDT